MGKLFDRLDHLWELAQINQAEQGANRSSILTGEVYPEGQDSQMTGFELARLDDIGRSERLRMARSTVGAGAGAFEKLRRKSRMKLLKTGQLMSDLRRITAICKACSGCHMVEGHDRPCRQHKNQLRTCIMAVKYAGEDNMDTRLAQGRVWGDDEPSTPEERGLNEWERMYYEDRKTGSWPWVNPAWSLKEYGDLGYKGWLQFLYEEGEMSHSDYLAEKERLNAVA